MEMRVTSMEEVYLSIQENVRFHGSYTIYIASMEVTVTSFPMEAIFVTSMGAMLTKFHGSHINSHGVCQI